MRIAGIRDSHFLILAYVVLFLLPLGLRPLGIPDEMRYAEIPREMLASGDWVVPTLNGLLYFEKPVLGYWLNAISIAVFGENAFAVRLPSALLAGLSACLIFFMLNKLNQRRVALIASCVQLSLMEVFFVGTYNVLDNLLAFTLCGVFVSYYFANIAQDSRERNKYLIATGVFCGLAFLAKGFLAFALPVMVIVAFLLYQKRYLDLLRHAWIPLLVASVVALPWSILIHYRAGDFWHYFFWIEHVKRFSGNNAQHASPFWIYIVALPLLAFPWSLYALRTVNGAISQVRSAKTDHRETQLVVYLALWFMLPLLFFSLAKGKLLTYLLPLFPALSMLCAMALISRANDESKSRALKALSPENLGMAILLLLSIALLYVHYIASNYAVFAATEYWRMWIIVIALLLGLLPLWLAKKCSNDWHRTLYIAATVLPFYVVWSSGVMLPEMITTKKAPGEFLRQQARFVDENTLLITDDSMLHASAWVFKRDNIYLLYAGEMAYGLSYENAKHRNLEQRSLPEFIRQHLDNQNIAIAYKGSNIPAFRDKLPPATTLIEKHKADIHFVFLSSDSSNDYNDRNHNGSQ